MNKSKLLRPLVTLVGCALCIGAYALPGSQATFVRLYNISPTSNLGKAKCTVCHQSMKGGAKDLNAYGRDVQAALKANHLHKVTDAILHSVESLDSTKSGSTNLVKIKADKNPGK